MKKHAVWVALVSLAIAGTMHDADAGKKHKGKGKQARAAQKLGPNTSSLTFKIRSYHPNQVWVALFSKSRQAEWPGGGKAWPIADYNVHDLSIACIPGELVCYGAWVDNNSAIWGVGRNGTQTGQPACATCNGGTVAFNLAQ